MNLPNLSIKVSGGKETKQDSNGERTESSLGCKPGLLPGLWPLERLGENPPVFRLMPAVLREHLSLDMLLAF